MRSAIVLLLSVIVSRAAVSQGTAALPDRGESFVAMSGVFAFYSDPVTNLHDFLLWNARARACRARARLPGGFTERAAQRVRARAGLLRADFRERFGRELAARASLAAGRVR